MTAPEPRRPRAFRIDDPALAAEDDLWVEEMPAKPPVAIDPAAEGPVVAPSTASRAIPWGGLMMSGLVGLAGLALSTWIAGLVAQSLASQGVVGWLATSLLVLTIVAGGALVVREAIGFARLAALERLRRDAERVLRLTGDDPAAASTAPSGEREIASAIVRLYADRPQMAWDLSNYHAHLDEIGDRGDLLKLADRDLLAPLDAQSRRIVLTAAKRVAFVTAITPVAAVDMIYVLVANVRMLREIATLYGGRPGLLASLRLGRMVITNLIAAGGIALTDDLVGQFIGQGIAGRLSRRLGEGAFNGALTARIGVQAIALTRPLPHVVSQPIRVRDILAEVFARQPAAQQAPGRGTGG